jgi:hypothetical protein
MLRYSPAVPRRLVKCAVLALPTLLALALPAVASAAPLDDLPGHASKFTVVDGFLVFGVAPVGVFLLVALLVMRPGTSSKAQRYRPGRDWTAAPSWSGLHPEAPSAMPVLESKLPVMDGAPEQKHADSGADSGEQPAAERGPQRDIGGARGSW